MSEPANAPKDQGSAWQRRMDAGEEAVRQGRHAGAEQQYLDALQIAEGFGPSDPRLVESLIRLGLLYAPPGKLAHMQKQAEPLLRRALAIQEGSRGPDSAEVCAC